MDFAPLAAALALAWKVIDFLKFARAADWNAVFTQTVSWAAGVVVVFLLAATDFASGIVIGDMNLDALNAASLVLVGLSFTSAGSVLYDFKRAIDGSDSAQTPKLLTGKYSREDV